MLRNNNNIFNTVLDSSKIASYGQAQSKQYKVKEKKHKNI
jgi:hypothetical protein